MIKPSIEMSFEQWKQEFEPINEFPYADVEEHNEFVWTVITTEYGDFITNGYSVFNADGYYITKKPFDKDITYDIDIPDKEEE